MKHKTHSSPLQDFLKGCCARGTIGLPKYARLQECLAAAIDQGLWKPGTRLPGEWQLSRITPFSLGTVQKAINRLVQDGRVYRLHGRGTFVAVHKKAVEEPLIYVHFRDDEGSDYLPVYPKVIGRRRVSDTGPWSAILKQRENNILCIEREFNVNDEFSVLSKLYLDTDRFPSFARKSSAQLRANLKRILASEFGVRILSYSQELMLQRIPSDVCDVLKVRRGSIGLHFAVVAYSKGQDPVYYQNLLIPPNSRRLRLPDIMQASY